MARKRWCVARVTPVFLHGILSSGEVEVPAAVEVFISTWRLLSFFTDAALLAGLWRCLRAAPQGMLMARALAALSLRPLLLTHAPIPRVPRRAPLQIQATIRLTLLHLVFCSMARPVKPSGHAERRSIVSESLLGIGGWQLLLLVEFPCQFLVAAARDCVLKTIVIDSCGCANSYTSRALSKTNELGSWSLEHVERRFNELLPSPLLKCQRLIIPWHYGPASICNCRACPDAALDSLPAS